ncbi:MAG: fimbria major subunit, partial [Duncaniella sp.]|nr:fimbria major subunit [Duncaniella sp.]
MKTFAKILFGFSAIVFAACSSNEPIDAPENPETPGNDVSYMSVAIAAPKDAGSRATDGGYEPSWKTEDEHTVNSADFYFFQKNGAYAFSATATVTPEKNDKDGNTPNFEYICKQILVLNGVKDKNYPEYLITVLNKPKGFDPGSTLQETAEKLTAFTDANNGFVMTTSSFFGDVKVNNSTDLRHDAKYFTTKLNPDDFKTSYTAAGVADPVEIHVERLKAKVEVTLSVKNSVWSDDNGVSYYKLSQTLGGGDNTTGNGGLQSQDNLYVRVIGWSLNATAKESRMSKILDDTWKDNTSTPLWTGWNKSSDWRSFWAKSAVYGINEVKRTDDSPLYYIPAKDVAGSKLAFDVPKDNNSEKNYDYCYENTNSPDNIFQKVDGGNLYDKNNKQVAVKTPLVTHVVLHTQIYKLEKDGEKESMKSAGKLVQYMGVLYTADSYKNLLLNNLQANNNLNFWVKTSAEGVTPETYKQIDNSFITISPDKTENHKLGQIAVSVNTENKTTVYKKTVKDDNTEEYVAYTDFNTAFGSALNSVIDKDNVAYGSDGNSDAFYYIPIEHHTLNKDGNQKTTADEGYYGVVRNHWYKLTINSFKSVGHLVFDPGNDDTPVIPEG